jgi:hypothetical protein
VSEKQPASYAILGDVHGHLQLALCTLARWQRERGRPFSAVFLCGDVGTFTEDGQLDNATRRHARDNPCELEFLTQWATVPQAPWIDAIFRPEAEGLGLTCPVVMVHGNHEGFAHLETLYPRRRRFDDPVPLDQLPPVDTAGHVLFLPPGWQAVTAEGWLFGGVGGIEAGQRRAKYHPMAYIDDDDVQHLLLQQPVDVLLTHQGPARVQGDHGSPTLDLLVDGGVARWWFHGHSTPVQEVTAVEATTVVPLGDLAFHNGSPGLRGWSILTLSLEGESLETDPPAFWREVRQKHWRRTERGWLVHPDLAPYVP